MLWIGQRIEGFIKAWDTAAIVRRRVSFAAEIDWIGLLRFARPGASDRQFMLPGIPKIIEIGELGFARLEQVLQLTLAGVDQRDITPVIAVARSAIFGVTVAERPEVGVGPAHRRLHDIMQGLERD